LQCHPEVSEIFTVLQVMIFQKTDWIDVFVKVKDKAIPLQAWTGPEGSRRLWLPDFKTIGT